jgi:hypothetical protein
MGCHLDRDARNRKPSGHRRLKALKRFYPEEPVALDRSVLAATPAANATAARREPSPAGDQGQVYGVRGSIRGFVVGRKEPFRHERTKHTKKNRYNTVDLSSSCASRPP